MEADKLKQLNCLLMEFKKTELEPMIDFNPSNKQVAFNTSVALDLKQAVNDVSEYANYLLHKRRKEES